MCLSWGNVRRRITRRCDEKRMNIRAYQLSSRNECGVRAAFVQSSPFDALPPDRRRLFSPTPIAANAEFNVRRAYTQSILTN